VAAPELPQAGQRELRPRDMWRPQSCPGLGSGSWCRRTRGGSGAAPGWATGAGAVGHVAAPGQAAGAGATGHVAAPELPPGRTAGAGAAGHVVAPELPRAGQLMLRLTTRRGV
jgi:hypothetical protein